MGAHQIRWYFQDPPAVVNLRVGPADLHDVVELFLQSDDPRGYGLCRLQRGDSHHAGDLSGRGRILGDLSIFIGHRGGFQHRYIDWDAIAAAVFPGLPGLAGGEIGGADFQGLMAASVVVVFSIFDQEFGQLLEGFRGVGVEEPDQGLTAALVLALGLRVPDAPGDPVASQGCQEEFCLADYAPPGLVEDHSVVAEQLLGNPIIIERGLQSDDGVLAVFQPGEGLRADVEAGAVVQELADQCLRPVGIEKAVFQSFELPHFHLMRPGEPQPGTAGARP